MLDILIVGGGPAGLTAGIYASRAGLETLLLEKTTVGGQAATTAAIENYPGFSEGIGGVELSLAMEEQALRSGLTITYQAAREIDCAGKRVRTDTDWYEARRLVLALGASPRKLGVEGEERFIGRGISFCATCDGALYRGRTVAVVGGGNSAAEEALYLAGIGCEVLLIHRRGALRAEEAMAGRVLGNPRIQVLWNSEVQAFEGDKKLELIRLNGERAEAVSAVFEAVGRLPDTALVKGMVDMDGEGFIVAGEDCRTSMPGVYVVGDARTKKVRQLVTAVADGAVAVSAFE